MTKDGIDRSISLLNDPRAKARSKSKSGPPRKTSTIDGMSMDSSVPSETGTSSAIKDEDDASVKELSGLMTAMRFVPPSVRFGRRGHK